MSVGFRLFATLNIDAHVSNYSSYLLLLMLFNKSHHICAIKQYFMPLQVILT